MKTYVSCPDLNDCTILAYAPQQMSMWYITCFVGYKFSEISTETQQH